LFWFKRLSALSSDEMGHTGPNEEGNGENPSGTKGEGQGGEGNEEVQKKRKKKKGALSV
jgi:hypothetical protein